MCFTRWTHHNGVEAGADDQDAGAVQPLDVVLCGHTAKGLRAQTAAAEGGTHTPRRQARSPLPIGHTGLTREKLPHWAWAQLGNAKPSPSANRFATRSTGTVSA